MFFVAIIFASISVSLSLPNQEYSVPEVQNVITVPPNCPVGQQWVNGQCREIWRNNPNSADLGTMDLSLWFKNRNVVTVPTNCPPGQQLINGVCRDIWRYFLPTTPLPMQFQYLNLERRYRRQADIEANMFEIPGAIINRNIINIPKQCPSGYKPDAFGICRQILE